MDELNLVIDPYLVVHLGIKIKQSCSYERTLALKEQSPGVVQQQHKERAYQRAAQAAIDILEDTNYLTPAIDKMVEKAMEAGALYEREAFRSMIRRMTGSVIDLKEDADA